MRGLERSFQRMTWFGGLWVFLVLVPAGARAAGDVPWREPPGSSERLKHLRLAQLTEGEAWETPGEDSTQRPSKEVNAGRLFMQFLGGMGASSAMSMSVGLLGMGTLLVTDSPYARMAVVGVSLAAMTFAFPLGVWGAGEAMGGDGSLLATTGGYLLGAAVPLVPLLIRMTMQSMRLGTMGVLDIALIYLAVILPPVGALVGYHLSDQGPRTEQQRRQRKLQLRPVVALSHHGASMGVGGVF
jgi:hypothetical protein